MHSYTETPDASRAFLSDSSSNSSGKRFNSFNIWRTSFAISSWTSSYGLLAAFRATLEGKVSIFLLIARKTVPISAKICFFKTYLSWRRSLFSSKTSARRKANFSFGVYLIFPLTWDIILRYHSQQSLGE